jgi:tol-pal system protein YbgF
MRATDDQAHQVDTLKNRISSIEKRISSESLGGGAIGKTAPLLSPTEAYTLAYNDYLRGNYDLAIMGFQNYLKEYPNSAFIPQALYWIGQSYYNKSAYADAVSFFEQIESRFPQHETAPNAMLKSGLSYMELAKPDMAKATLQRVIDKFPQSNEAHLAKDKLMSLH